MVEENTEEISVTKEEVKKHLTEILRQEKNMRIDVKGLSVDKLADFPTKSEVFRISKIVCDMEYAVDIPNVIVGKRYYKSHEEEYKTEKNILKMAEDDLHWILGNRDIRVYPRFYGDPDTIDSNKRLLFREFIYGPTIDFIAREKLKEDGRLWLDDDVLFKDPLYPIALLHVKSGKIREKLGKSRLSEMTSEEIAKKFTKYIIYILKVSGKNLRDNVRIEIRNLMEELAEEYLTRKELKRVINGDLDIYPHHITPTRILDAGSMMEGALTRDLGFYGDPIFSGGEKKHEEKIKETGKRIRETIKHYIEITDELEESLGYKRTNLDSIIDLLEQSEAVVFFNGAIRRANSMLAYRIKDAYTNKKDLSEKIREKLKREIERDVIPYIKEFLFFSSGLSGFIEKKDTASKLDDIINELRRQVENGGYKISGFDSLNPTKISTYANNQ